MSSHGRTQTIPTGRGSTRAARAAAFTSVLAAAIVAAPVAAATDQPVSDRLKAMTQRFSDAGQMGDGATMASMFDDDVVFFNENGDRASKSDMATPGSPPPKGVSVQMRVLDWQCRSHGDAAVTSFIDEQTLDFHGQVTVSRFRSVETWLEEKGGWKMIGSQTLALPNDPAAVTLPVATLDAYVGAYIGAGDTRFVFTRNGADLYASINGGPQTMQKAEITDVLFTPGRARFRKIFQRDAAGHVTGFISRHEGHDIVFTRV